MLLWNGFPYVTSAAELCALLASLVVLLVEAPYNTAAQCMPHRACIGCCNALAVNFRVVEGHFCALGTLYASLGSWGLWIPLLNDSEWMSNDGKWSIAVSFLLLMIAGLLLVLAHVRGEGKRIPAGAADALWFALACVLPMLNVGLYADLPVDSNAWGNGHWHWVWGLLLVIAVLGILYMASIAGTERDTGKTRAAAKAEAKEADGDVDEGVPPAPQLAIAAAGGGRDEEAGGGTNPVPQLALTAP